MGHTHPLTPTWSARSPCSTFPRTKLAPRFPLLNHRDLFSRVLEFCRFRFGTSELRESHLFEPGCRPERPEQSQPNVFIDGRKQSVRQHRLAVIGRQVSGVFEIPYVKWQPLKAHTHKRTPTLFLPSRRFKRSQMGHGEAITPLFVLVLIRLVKCSQAWPGVYTLLPVVPVAHCTARLQPTDLVTEQQYGKWGERLYHQ